MSCFSPNLQLVRVQSSYFMLISKLAIMSPICITIIIIPGYDYQCNFSTCFCISTCLDQHSSQVQQAIFLASEVHAETLC